MSAGESVAVVVCGLLQKYLTVLHTDSGDTVAEYIFIGFGKYIRHIVFT